MRKFAVILLSKDAKMQSDFIARLQQYERIIVSMLVVFFNGEYRIYTCFCT